MAEIFRPFWSILAEIFILAGIRFWLKKKEKGKKCKPIKLRLPFVVCLNEPSPLLLLFIYLFSFFSVLYLLGDWYLLFIFCPLESSLILLVVIFYCFQVSTFHFASSSVSHVIGFGNHGKVKKKKSTISVRHSDLLTSFLQNKFLSVR